MVIIHHNDADGRLAAHIAGRAVERSNAAKGRSMREPIVYIEADYAKVKTPEWKRVMEEAITSDGLHDVCIVDFSLSAGEMLRLRDWLRGFGRELIWIDHHASCKDYPQEFEGLRDFTSHGPAGCQLAWAYFNGSAPEPDLVKLVGDYDAWRLKFAPDCKRLILYLDSVQPPPGSAMWGALLNDGGLVARAVERGQAMEEYRDGFCAGMCKAFGFETTFEGLRCYALNIYRTGSMAFGNRMEEYDACLAFIYDGRMWTVSMYSTKPEVDCSAICKKHGGGGHKGASGFQCQQLPFTR